MGSQARLSCNKHIWLKVLGIREKETLSVDVTRKKILMDESYTLITNLTLPENVGIPKHRSLKRVSSHISFISTYKTSQIRILRSFTFIQARPHLDLIRIQPVFDNTGVSITSLAHFSSTEMFKTRTKWSADVMVQSIKAVLSIVFRWVGFVAPLPSKVEPLSWSLWGKV